jgi:outer membrane protein assembly factor BamB
MKLPGRLVALEPQAGKVLWERPIDKFFGWYLFAPAITADGSLGYAGVWDGRTTCAIQALRLREGSLKWQVSGNWPRPRFD